MSPYSIRAALALVYLAAPPGEIRHRLRTALGYSEDHGGLDLRLLAGTVHTTPQASFETSGSLWIGPQHSLRKAYLESVSQQSFAEVHGLDFSADPRRALRTINAWAAERTRGSITNLLQDDDVTRDTVMALIDVVYFHGKWLSPFDRSNTAPGDFRTSTGASVKVSMMSGAECRAVTGKGYRAAYADYAGTSMAFAVVVPDRWKDFAWDIAGFERAWDALRDSDEARFELPRFRIRTRENLERVAAKLGVALDDERVLQGLLATNSGAKLDRAVHEASFLVDEDSTQAAAATAATVEWISEDSLPPVFRVDRPFYFLLVERRTGLIIFMGQVIDPSTVSG